MVGEDSPPGYRLPCLYLSSPTSSLVKLVALTSLFWFTEEGNLAEIKAEADKKAEFLG